jgi:hypothetical protein
VEESGRYKFGNIRIFMMLRSLRMDGITMIKNKNKGKKILKVLVFNI